MEWVARYRNAVSALWRPISLEDVVSAEIVQTAERRLGVRVPGALRDYYLVAGRIDRLNRAHNRLYAPEDWFLDQDHLVFMEENQGVVFWGVESNQFSAADPPVLQGVNVIGQPTEWHFEHDRCSDFLVIMLYWQAVCGGMDYVGISSVSPDTLSRISSTWSFVGQSQDLTAYGREGQAACVVGEGASLQLFAGGRSEPEFAMLEAELASMGVRLEQV
jgi:hypothetical protein